VWNNNPPAVTLDHSPRASYDAKCAFYTVKNWWGAGIWNADDSDIETVAKCLAAARIENADRIHADLIGKDR